MLPRTVKGGLTTAELPVPTATVSNSRPHITDASHKATRPKYSSKNNTTFPKNVGSSLLLEVARLIMSNARYANNMNANSTIRISNPVSIGACSKASLKAILE